MIKKFFGLVIPPTQSWIEKSKSNDNLDHDDAFNQLPCLDKFNEIAFGTSERTLIFKKLPLIILNNNNPLINYNSRGTAQVLTDEEFDFFKGTNPTFKDQAKLKKIYECCVWRVQDSPDRNDIFLINTMSDLKTRSTGFLSVNSPSFDFDGVFIGCNKFKYLEKAEILSAGLNKPMIRIKNKVFYFNNELIHKQIESENRLIKILKNSLITDIHFTYIKN